MKLTIFSRKELKKGDTKKIRREGNIPGILYGSNQSNENIIATGSEFQAILRNLKQGLLATTIFELHEGKKVRKAIVKEVQYHPVDHSIRHIDFALIDEKQTLTVNVPIQIAGVAECTGIKLGGFLRQVLRTLKVRCLPKDIPQEFVLDIRELDVTGSKRLADIAIPSNVLPLDRMDQVAVVIAKKV